MSGSSPDADRRVGPVVMTVFGDELDERTASGLWPSDHGGLFGGVALIPQQLAGALALTLLPETSTGCGRQFAGRSFVSPSRCELKLSPRSLPSCGCCTRAVTCRYPTRPHIRFRFVTEHFRVMPTGLSHAASRPASKSTHGSAGCLTRGIVLTQRGRTEHASSNRQSICGCHSRPRRFSPRAKTTPLAPRCRPRLRRRRSM